MGLVLHQHPPAWWTPALAGSVCAFPPAPLPQTVIQRLVQVFRSVRPQECTEGILNRPFPVRDKVLRLRGRSRRMGSGSAPLPLGHQRSASLRETLAPRLVRGCWVQHPCPAAAGAALLGTPHLQEVPSLTVDGDQVVVDGDELLRLADEEGSAVQLRPVGSEGELALETQHVQAP